MVSSSEKKLSELIKKIACDQDADILFYNGPLARPHDTLIIRECIHRRRRKNVILMMSTTGGDPDAAYRIARCLQSKYDKFVFYVSGYCKSAGTIIALGAHELVVSDFGELGPLDVQMSKKDELFEQQSGLTVMDAITTLNEKSYAAFKEFFLKTNIEGSGSITMHTAAEIATQLTTGLFSKLYGQIDPMHVGEAGRAMKIAEYYGSRLLNKSRNITQENLKYLSTYYPYHGFVIDRPEAKHLFENVREPTEDEFLMADLILDKTRLPGHTNTPEFEFLNHTLTKEPTTGVTTDERGTGEIEGQQLGRDDSRSGERSAEDTEAQQSGNIPKTGESRK